MLRLPVPFLVLLFLEKTPVQAETEQLATAYSDMEQPMRRNSLAARTRPLRLAPP
ncbi:hypothetical protein QYF48_24600 [Brevibacillus agri]|uniref:hypothetical protein n=1 Tax=Brevibacillus agri TaxID=51101 RepID=UPI000AF8B374|nr:hypothetical protein [Brevibacillus agri]MDN4095953.1 hypothetical protein [Brevibacillus agri]